MTRPFPFLMLRMTVLGSLLSLWSCASTPELDLLLAESPRGAVYLERIPDRSFQAAHPIKIDQDTLARVLRGISVKEHQGLLQDFLAGQTPVLSAFTDDEIRFLAPLLAEGLTRAASDQQIGFRLIQPGSPGDSQSVAAGAGSSESPVRLALMETSRGYLYAYGRSLYVTLVEYRVRSERAASINKANRRLPDPSGLMNRTLSFTPESANRPDSYRGKNTTGTTLVIDYEGLAAFSTNIPAQSNHSVPAQGAARSPIPSSAPDAGTEGRLRLLQEQMGQKNRELEDLRKELQDIRRQLTEPTKTPPASSR